MARQQTLQSEVLSSKVLKKGTLAKDILSVAYEDYPIVLRGIAAQETAEQVAVGNKPTNILVDNRKGKKIDEALYSIKVSFVAVEDIQDAVHALWQEMQRLMMRSTGETARHLEVWQGIAFRKAHYVGNSPSVVTTASLTPRTGTYIAGPMTANTRKFRWLSSAGKKFKASRRKELKGLKARDKPKTTMAVQEVAIRNVKRRYPQLSIVYTFITVPNLNTTGKTPVNRVPAIAVWARNKGRI